MPILEPESHRVAGVVLERLRASMSASEFGFRVQALSFHIMINLGAQPVQLNSSGHPDAIVSNRVGLTRVEVEADLGGNRPRQLTPDDLESIRPRSPGDEGYFAVLFVGPFPRWAVVPYRRVSKRAIGAPPSLLLAISESRLSASWTTELVAITERNEARLEYLTFDRLKELAFRGNQI